MTQQSHQAYISQRTQLIAHERALRFDAQAIAQSTDAEKRALHIVNELRERDARDIWNASTEKLVYPGMEFLIAKETISESNNSPNYIS